jgi:cobalamin biosynthetic protein CobC
VIEHGGNLAVAAERYGIEPSRWLDLSTGISPFAYPVGELDAETWRCLPSSPPGFHDAVARYYGSTAFQVVPGSQAAIQLLPRLIPACSVAVVQPTYAEHARSWGTAAQVVSEDAIERAEGFDVVVVCNPNNPTGLQRPPETLLALLRRQRLRAGWLVVDEAFIDTEPQSSLVPHAGEPGLVVLRSIGKFFGLAGARVGFLFAPAELLAQANEALGPWPVSGPALAVTARALTDRQFCDSARTRLKNASARLQQLLKAQGHDIAGATHFFVWIRHRDARHMQDHLARAAILVRAFDEPPSLRFGLPGTEAAWQRLEDALATL